METSSMSRKETTAHEERVTAIVQAAEQSFAEFMDSLVKLMKEGGLNIETRVVPGRVSGVRQSIIELVRESDFLTSSQIADQLEERIVTKSEDPRRVIMSTVSALVRENVFERDALGRISLTRAPEEVAA